MPFGRAVARRRTVVRCVRSGSATPALRSSRRLRCGTISAMQGKQAAERLTAARNRSDQFEFDAVVRFLATGTVPSDDLNDLVEQGWSLPPSSVGQLVCDPLAVGRVARRKQRLQSPRRCFVAESCSCAYKPSTAG